MTRRIMTVVALLAFVGLFGLVVGCGGDKDGSGLPDGVVARVGDVDITEGQLEARIEDFKAQYPSSIPDEATDPDRYKTFTQNVLEYLVTLEIAGQNAAELGATVTDEDVQAQIDSIRDLSFGGDQSKFDEALQAQNMTLDQLKSVYRESMLQQKVYEAVTKDITTVPDEDISAYYEENKDDYFVEETRTARHILIAPTSDDDSTTSTTAAGGGTPTTAAPTTAQWAAAKAQAEKVRAELVAGGDWTALAAQYSDDPGSKDSGGDLGVVYKGQMVPEFEESVFSLTENEISQPVKTAYGYHIIQVTQITEAKQSPLEEVKDYISTLLVNEKKGETWEQWLESMKTKLNVRFGAGMQIVTTTTAVTTQVPQPDGTTSTEAGSTITTAAP